MADNPDHPHSDNAAYRVSNKPERKHKRMQGMETIQAAIKEQYVNRQAQQSIGNSSSSKVPTAFVYRTQSTQPASIDKSDFQQYSVNYSIPYAFYNPTTYPVQPHGFGMLQPPQQQADRHVQLAHVDHASANSHVAFDRAKSQNTTSQHYYHKENTNTLRFWRLHPAEHDTPAPHLDERAAKEQVESIKRAHYRLEAVVKSDGPPSPLHETTLSSKPSLHVSATGSSGGVLLKPKVRASTSITKAKSAADVVLSQPGITIASQFNNVDGVNKSENKPPKTLTLSASGGQCCTSHKSPTEATLVPIDIKTCEEIVEDFHKAHSEISGAIAPEAHEDLTSDALAGSTERLRITVNALNVAHTDQGISTSTIYQKRNGLNPSRFRKRKHVSASPGRKSTTTHHQVANRQEAADIQDLLKDKRQPQDVRDLLRLIAFETQCFNVHPQRQIELETVNRNVARENIARGLRIARLRRELHRRSERGTAKPTMSPPKLRSSLLRAKREGSPISHCVVERKARKLEQGDKPGTGDHDDGRDMKVSENYVPVSQEKKPETDYAEGDLATEDIEMADRDVSISSASERHQRSQSQEAMLTSAHRESHDGTLDAEEDDQVIEATLQLLLDTPKLQKVMYVPKQTVWLTRRVERLGFRSFERPERGVDAWQLDRAEERDG
ncbi:uncharacterized protein PV09_04113 [Verruconis gallopava]|uniref:Uncharacterized protein n=1 Tax=Verruconis gallopava TaxID=253628 RepID=A0A0D2ADC5_9PEZI|nr:uncharacterized protein PV09_04113 [Verruconis gallopava]KIW04948.1 hypothetical protein PV09_04113 [Verruconis gallopava]